MWSGLSQHFLVRYLGVGATKINEAPSATSITVAAACRALLTTDVGAAVRDPVQQ